MIDENGDARIAGEGTYVPTDRLNTVHSNLVGGGDARLADWQNKREEEARRLAELEAEGIDHDIAVLQAAKEFGINANQVKVSLGRSEVDAFIPGEVWDHMSPPDQALIRSRIFAIFDDGREGFEVDFYQEITKLIPGWPDPRTTVPPGSIIFSPDGTVVHEPLGQ